MHHKKLDKVGLLPNSNKAQMGLDAEFYAQASVRIRRRIPSSNGISGLQPITS